MGPVLVLVARDDSGAADGGTEDTGAEDGSAGPVPRSSLALLTIARRLGSPIAVLPGPVDIVTLGVLGYYGATRVVEIEPQDGADAASASADTGQVAHALVGIARREQPSMILLTAGPRGGEVAARMAVRLDSGVLTDAVDLVPGPEGPVAIQEAFTGSWLVGAAVRRGIPIITVRADAAVPEPAAVRQPVDVTSVAPDLDCDRNHGSDRHPAPRVRVLSRTPKPGVRRPDLTTATVVVAGGRGVGSAAGFELLREVADALGGAVGGSHAAADLGWCPPREQIDQTGTTVCPRLYLACGISGSVRHRAGMQDSRTIVAIDTDPAAPIFRIADFGVVGDLRQVLPALLAEIARRRGASLPDNGAEASGSPPDSPTHVPAQLPAGPGNRKLAEA